MQATERDIEALVDEHQVDLWAYLRLLGCTASEADDLVQESFLVLLRKRGRVKPAGVGAFLRTTARQLFLTAHRRRRRREDILRAEAAAVLWERRVAQGGFASFVESLRSCLERLDAESRELLDLRYGQARSGRQIAEAVGLSVSNVDTLLHRCRARLQACIERRMSR